jgi:hypothetical protein
LLFYCPSENTIIIEKSVLLERAKNKGAGMEIGH